MATDTHILPENWYDDSHQYRLVREKLRTTKCTEEFLIKVIEYMDIRDIYRNQVLSENFIMNYILNPSYHSSSEDSYITYHDVVHAQDKLKKRLKGR